MAMGCELMLRPIDPLCFLSTSHAYASTISFIHAPGMVPCGAASKTLVSSLSTPPQTISKTVASYGPSLRSEKASHGNEIYIHPLSKHRQSSGLAAMNDMEEDESVFVERAFTRVFDIAALRVPCEQCLALENRLRGHLLNWPRVPNIAMFSGGNTEEEPLPSLNFPICYKRNDDDSFLALNSRAQRESDGGSQWSNPILERDKLARKSDLHGFRMFKNLRKMTMRRRETKKDEVFRVKKKPYRNDRFAIVIVEDGEEVNMEGFRGLLGNEFQGKMWSASTRLLLLDERYAAAGRNDMPGIIKDLLQERCKNNWRATYEIVRCKLTLFYKYWSMNEILEASLPLGTVIPTSFETVGHIAYLNLREEHLPFKEFIAKVVLDKNKPKIRTVVSRTDKIGHPFQNLQLEVLAGNRSLVTTISENGLRFHIDMKTLYWNSRLATERQRLVSSFRPEDIVCDVFAGVGSIALPAAKKVKRVYANDYDHNAVEYLERNKVLNKLEFKIEVYSMDGKQFIETALANQNANSITQVVISLPNQDLAFLGAFRGIFGNGEGKIGNLPRIHLYGFSDADDMESDFNQRIRASLGGHKGGYSGDMAMEMVRVWAVTPGKWMLYSSFDLPEQVAMEALKEELQGDRDDRGNR